MMIDLVSHAESYAARAVLRMRWRDAPGPAASAAGADGLRPRRGASAGHRWG